jgi:hypothetical protein
MWSWIREFGRISCLSDLHPIEGSNPLLIIDSYNRILDSNRLPHDF